MKNTTLTICFLLIFSLSLCSFNQKQNRFHLSVTFEIENKNECFSKDLTVYFQIGNEKIIPFLFLNGFVVPDFKNSKLIDVVFIYKGKKYLFSEVPISAFDQNWIFGIDNKPFKSTTKKNNKKAKEIFYLKFNPKDGDGTQIIISR